MATYLSVAEMIARQQRTADADAKDPAELTDADLADLSDDRRTELIDSGMLARFGIGPRRAHRGRR